MQRIAHTIFFALTNNTSMEKVGFHNNIGIICLFIYFFKLFFSCFNLYLERMYAVL